MTNKKKPHGNIFNTPMDLRQAGWDIVTMAAKQKGYYLYYLVSMPGDNKTTMRKGNAMSRKRLKSIA